VRSPSAGGGASFRWTRAECRTASYAVESHPTNQPGAPAARLPGAPSGDLSGGAECLDGGAPYLAWQYQMWFIHTSVRQVYPMDSRLVTLLLLAGMAAVLTGCPATPSATEVSLDFLLQHPDRYYLSPVLASGVVALPVQSGRSLYAGTYKLVGPSQGSEVLVLSAQLPAPGVSVQVSARVTMDPATSRPVLVEESRREWRGSGR